MKPGSLTRKSFFLFLIPFLPFIFCNAQNAKIDSLLKVLKSEDEGITKINTLNSLAYEFRSNSPDSAIYFANEALALATKLNFKIGIADSYLWMGGAKINIAKFDEAMNHLEEAIKLYDKLLLVVAENDKTSDKTIILKHKASAFHNLGIIYDIRSNFPEALKNDSISLKIREEIGDKIGISDSYNGIGIVYGDQGNFPEALKYHFSA